MKLADLIQYMVRYNNCQVIISTHSPFLLSMEDAKIYDLDTVPVNVCKFNDLDSMKKYVDLFQKHFYWYTKSDIWLWRLYFFTHKEWWTTPKKVWFGLYMCPDKLKPIYGNGWAKEKRSDGYRVGWLLWMRLQSWLPLWDFGAVTTTLSSSDVGAW